MTIVSRLQLDHPALGAIGGASLHTQIEDIYKKIGDNMADRYFSVTGLADSGVVTLEHNFSTDYNNIRIDVYEVIAGVLTDLLVSDYSTIATSGQETTHVDLTNSSGFSKDFAVVILNDPIDLNELRDVNIDENTLLDGHTIKWNATSEQWENGVGGGGSNFTVTIGSGPTDTYPDIASAMPNLVSGDRVLIRESINETAELIIYVSGVYFEANYGVVIGVSPLNNANAVEISGSDLIIRNFYVASNSSGPLTYGINLASDNVVTENFTLDYQSATVVDQQSLYITGNRNNVDAYFKYSSTKVSAPWSDNGTGNNINIRGF